MKSSSRHSQIWIYIFVGVGACGILGMSVLSAAIMGARLMEYRRFVGCANQTRTDCNASFLWDLNGWVLSNVPL